MPFSFFPLDQGENEFGVFRLDGIAKRSVNSNFHIQLRKRYTVQVGAIVKKEFATDGGTIVYEGTIISYDAENDGYVLDTWSLLMQFALYI